MARDPDKIDRWVTLEAVEAAIPAMEATGTSEVARGVKPSKQTSVGFIEAYRFAEGAPETMADLPATKTSSWAERRRQFIVRHLAQMRSRDTHSDGFRPDGTPTKRMLGLIAWAYLPPESQKKAKAWFKKGCPMKASRKRRNPSRREALLQAQILPVPKAADSLVRRLGRGRVGSTERVLTRGDAAEVPGLARMGYLQIVRILQPSETGVEWKVYDVKTTRRLHAAVDATQAAREAYREEFQQASLFGRNNPSAWDDPKRKGSQVQSIIFDASRFSLGEARAWLRRHAYDGLSPDRTANTIRFRQRPPSRYRDGSFRTIPMGRDTGIQAVVGVPR